MNNLFYSFFVAFLLLATHASAIITEAPDSKVIPSVPHNDDHAISIKNAISDDYKESAAYVVSNLILAYGVMQALEIHQVKYVGTPGANATGILLSPRFWIRGE